MQKLDTQGETKVFNMRVPSAWLKKVDSWRRKQDDVPGRSEAVRRMVELWIESEKKAKR